MERNGDGRGISDRPPETDPAPPLAMGRVVTTGPGAALVLHADGDVTIFDTGGSPLWNTGTAR